MSWRVGADSGVWDCDEGGSPTCARIERVRGFIEAAEMTGVNVQIPFDPHTASVNHGSCFDQTSFPSGIPEWRYTPILRDQLPLGPAGQVPPAAAVAGIGQQRQRDADRCCPCLHVGGEAQLAAAGTELGSHPAFTPSYNPSFTIALRLGHYISPKVLPAGHLRLTFRVIPSRRASPRPPRRVRRRRARCSPPPAA